MNKIQPEQMGVDLWPHKGDEMSELQEKLEAIKSAIDERLKLHERIKSAGAPPHTDYWHQSISVANEKISGAYKDLNDCKYF